MFSSSKLYNKRVYVVNKKGVRKNYGKIRSVVFHPSKAKAIGVIVKRPDIALMVKRKDSFVALDRMEIRTDGPLIIDQPDTWDKAACMRLGVEFDKCILWDYMPVRTTAGRELGQISSVFFDEGTFEVDHIDISSGSANRKILGAANIERSRILGYKDGAIIVDDAVGNVEESGGAAAAAGEAWATAKHKGSQAAANAGKKAGEAVDKGAYGLGKAVGSLKSAATETVSAAKAEAAGANEAQAGAAEATAAEGASGAAHGLGKAIGTLKNAAAETVDAAKAEAGEVSRKQANTTRTPGKTANALGKQLGKASHMFKDFKDEYDRASRGE